MQFIRIYSETLRVKIYFFRVVFRGFYQILCGMYMLRFFEKTSEAIIERDIIPYLFFQAKEENIFS